MSRLPSFILILVSALLAPLELAAHHVVSESGVAWVEPMRIVQVELGSSRFDLGPTWKGRWWSMSSSLEWSFTRRLSLMGRLPLLDIDFDDGRKVRGLGDVELSLKALAYASKHGGFIASGGLGVELPTGSAADALGAGHVELTPYLALSTQPARWLLVNLLAADRISLEDQSVMAHGGSPLSVHSPHELQLRPSAALVHPKGHYATLGVDQVILWRAEDRAEGEGPTTLRGELGWRHDSSRWRVALRAELPVRGPHRHEFLSTLNLAIWL